MAGVAHAKALGLRVLVTDHHLPAVIDGRIELPAADALVNPSQPGCGFASKNLAGVGVAFYVLLALRSELRQRGRYDNAPQPKLDGLLDLVALGTVADVVKLDANNRRLVAQGLKRMRAGRVQPGIAALFTAAGRDCSRANAFDLGFALGPRINAAGRLSDMTLGIECLLSDDPTRALELARQLDAINRERREIEADMREQAEFKLDELMQDPRLKGEPPAALALFEPEFHEGVVGIIASRLKDRIHRPTFRGFSPCACSTPTASSTPPSRSTRRKGACPARTVSRCSPPSPCRVTGEHARRGDVFLEFGGEALAESELALLEVTVPFQARPGAEVVGIGQFVLEGASITREFAALDRSLFGQAAVVFGVGTVLLGLSVGWAFRRVQLKQRQLADRTAGPASSQRGVGHGRPDFRDRLHRGALDSRVEESVERLAPVRAGPDHVAHQWRGSGVARCRGLDAAHAADGRRSRPRAA